MIQSAFETATGDRSQVPEDWMPATATRALILEDPILVWLEFHGEANGFQKDASPYEFTEFLFEKGKQFERKWLSVYAPEAVRVCDRANEVLQAEKVRQTLDLMARGTPAIAAPALGGNQSASMTCPI
ncbi:hypothetical protein HC928_06830 [bacterium]|nr:hypothetical protein [bacterium]